MKQTFQSSLGPNSGVTKSSTNIQSLSNMSSSADKDTLIDEMQTKIGDLLKTNQEIVILKKENDSLKQQISINQSQFQSEKETYIKEIEQLKIEIQKHIENEENMMSINEKLKASKIKKTNQLNELQSECLKLQEIIEQTNLKSSEKIEKLKRIISQKDELTNEMQIQINDLKTENSVNSNAFAQQQAEFERISEESVEFQNQVENLEKKSKQQIRTIKTLNKQINDKENSINSLNQTISDLQKENESFEEQITNKTNEMNSLEQKCAKIIKYCKVSDIDELFEHIKKKRHEGKMLKKAIKTSQAILTESQETLQKEMLEKEEKISKINELNEETNQLKNELTSRIETLEKDLERLNCSINHLNRRDVIGRTISKVNKMMINRFQKITFTINNQIEEPTLKSLIHASLMLNRWKQLCGTKKEYANDCRNWWWLGKNDGPEKKDEIIEAIQKYIKDINDEKETNAKLNQELADLRTQNDGKDNLIQQQEEKIKTMNTTINEQSQTIESKVNREDFDAIYNKYTQIKKYMKAILEEVKAKDNKIQELSAMLISAQQGNENNMTQIEKTNSDLAEIQATNEKLQDELELVYSALNEKSRELLLLERKLSFEASENELLHSHIKSVSIDNQRLNPYARDVATFQKCDESDLSQRLQKMANNLSGTLCD
ncbi:hypothetical protein M9Y10_016613 [Tritrichomonas musculus]|uniref:Viral A-type inclusion protein n=1 Tax=Tritrichomonas musculus TaxID=1915356 RepID=A0ABR2HWP1_9EUKA